MRLWVILIGLIVMADISRATPPSEINCQYDKAKKILQVELKHVSKDPRDHFIRKLIVTKNKEKPVEKKYNRQTNPTQLVESFPLTAKTGDKIKVKAVCSLAGTKEVEYIIP